MESRSVLTGAKLLEFKRLVITTGIVMLIIVYGTRGELVKLSSLILELKKHKIDFYLVDSHQQDTFEITKALHLSQPNIRFPQSPRQKWSQVSAERKINISVIGPYGLLASISALNWMAGIVAGFKKVFTVCGGPVIFVGNTITASAVMIAAKACKIKLVSYEAGLRTGVNEPLLDWPYILGDKSSDILFARSKSSEDVILSEHINGKVFRIENPVVDIVSYAKKLIGRHGHLGENYILANSVRSLNSRRNAENYVNALIECDKNVMFSPNATIRRRLERHGLIKRLVDAGVSINNSRNYIDYLRLLLSASLAITDSNGVEEECSVLRKFCIVTNNFVQYPELENRSAIVTGCNKQKILDMIEDCYGRKSTPTWKSGGTLQAIRIIKKEILE